MLDGWIGWDWIGLDWMGYPIPLWHQEHRSRAMLIIEYVPHTWVFMRQFRKPWKLNFAQNTIVPDIQEFVWVEDSIKIPHRNSLLGYFMSGNRTEETKVCRNVKLDFLQVDKALQVERLKFFSWSLITFERTSTSAKWSQWRWLSQLGTRVEMIFSGQQQNQFHNYMAFVRLALLV